MIGKLFRKRGKQEFAITLPSVPRRKLYISISQYAVAAIYVAEIGAAYPVYKLSPRFRLYGAV